MPNQITEKLSSLEALAAERSQFVSDLVERQMITADFAASGVLDRFRLDAEHGDALKHILIGDEHGGAHYLPTMMEFDPLATVATVLNPQDQKQDNTYRYNQRLRDQGEFASYRVSSHGKNKSGFSSMFPSEWPLQQVIETITETLATPGIPNPERKTIVHDAKVRGMKVRTVTNEQGQIITSSPKFRRKPL